MECSDVCKCSICENVEENFKKIGFENVKCKKHVLENKNIYAIEFVEYEFIYVVDEDYELFKKIILLNKVKIEESMDYQFKLILKKYNELISLYNKEV